MNMYSNGDVLPIRQSILSRNRDAHLPQRPATRQNSTVSHPLALPCPDYYEQFPERVGAVGNVVVTSKRELEKWLLIARPVSWEEAEKHGGCIVYVPNMNTSAKLHGADTRYYCITDSDDTVYGRATYVLLSESLAFAEDECRKAEEEDEEAVFTNAFDDCDSDPSEDGKLTSHKSCTRKSGCRCRAEECRCTANGKKKLLCFGDG